MRVVLEKLLRNGNMDIYQISRTEVVCFAFHDDLLFLSWNAGKIMRIIDCIRRESSVFFTPEKMISSQRNSVKNPFCITSPLVNVLLEFEEICGGY
jgi:hypothetical protein